MVFVVDAAGLGQDLALYPPPYIRCGWSVSHTESSKSIVGNGLFILLVSTGASSNCTMLNSACVRVVQSTGT